MRDFTPSTEKFFRKNLPDTNHDACLCRWQSRLYIGNHASKPLAGARYVIISFYNHVYGHEWADRELMNSILTSAGSFLRHVTPIILTYNEAPNIRRSLERLHAFDEIVIVDSGSTDETLNIVNEFPNTRVVSRPFDSFAGQWNFALREGGLKTEWALAMDADYILSDEFIAELDKLAPSPENMAYRISFDYCVFGRKLSATLYPPIIALHRHSHTQYIQDGHCMRAQVSGVVGELKSRVLHDDRKSLARWLSSQASYAVQEANLLRSHTWSELKVQDKIRRLIFIAPWLVPLYCLTIGRGFLDGRAGLFYAMQRGVAESILAIQLLETDLRGKQ